MKRGTLWGCTQLLLFLLFFSNGDAAELLIPAPENGICKSIDIRNRLDFFKQLDGCQVIEGSLSILLFENVNETEIAQISFPELVEITDYLMLFRVNGLKSIGQLFPNLAVIRGQHLFLGRKALVIYEMPSLQEIGLYSLTKIMSGLVYIDKNPSLCFVHSIDWNKIINTDESNMEGGITYSNFLKSFKPDNECPVCPASSGAGKPCPRNEKDSNKFLCWNRNHCQKICTKCGKKACNDKGECCDARCIGSCGSDTSRCIACREFIFNTGEDSSAKCVEKCPYGFLAYLERRCVSRSECINMTRPLDFESESEVNTIEHPYKIHEDSCVIQCPPNYSGNYTDHSCKKCNNTCRKECPGARIDSINLARELRGCTHITGSIEIQIRGGNQVVKSLQENLGMIEEIDGYLKVVRSFSLVSLNFLSKLKKIRGKILENQRYSLIVLDNQNLQDLFDWNTHKDFEIDNGSLFFHFNPKLCIEKISELRKKANLPAPTELEVASNSNGDKVACTVSKLDVHITSISSKYASLEWHPFEIDDPRKLLNYIVYSIEAPTKNVNFFDGRDACGQDNWHVDDVPNIFEQNPVTHNLINLKPFTQYAFFVKTYTIATEENGAQSDIYYFKTKPAQPSEPGNLQINSYSNDSLSIKWSAPVRPNGNISYYIVTGIRHDHTTLPNRNYCIDSVVPDLPKKSSTVAPKTKTPNNCKCTKDKQETKLIDEQVEEARIDFENALHNKVYVKRLLVNRNPRSVEKIIDKNTHNVSQPQIEVPIYLHMENTSFQFMIEKLIVPNTTEPGTNVWETFTYFIKAPITSIYIKNLHHFTLYNVAVRACRDIEKDEQELVCGDPADATAETLEKKGADNINNVSIVNITSDSVTVRWAQPPDPNRMIVSVTIWYRREGSKNSQYIGECISFQDFKNYTKSDKFMVYTIPKLFPGNHSLYLKASSLFGIGEASPILTFEIPDSGPSIILIICMVLIFILLGAIGGVWFFYRRTMRKSFMMNPSVNPDYMPSIYVVDEWEVPRKNIELVKELGQGSFGMVWEGTALDCKDVKELKTRCAVKTVNEHATRRERIDFLNEASVMKAFNTTHVVKLLGVVSQGQPALVVMELMVNGDLKSYLRSHRPDENNDGRQPPTLKEILQMAIEIADGMAYLEGKKFVHRDLAARNCMVAEDMTVKIGDFGMTRDIYETDYYRKGSRGLLPVRWMSPESLRDGVFSSGSDAWSFGIVLWEMATLASQPYQGLSNEQALRFIMDGGFMERPENCPDKLYYIMRLCWNLKPSSRPSFMRLCEILLQDANEKFAKVSFYHSKEGTELRAIKAAAQADEVTRDAVELDDPDPTTPLNMLPPDVRKTYSMSNSQKSDSIHLEPNPRFYSVSEDRTANGFIGRNGNAQTQC
ncbi:unnamed protein product [Ceutorhynchus assimilis]|uniref:Tyrosine-protein kinase receptor n=1 Tax=Ceutorhynchus assimilis TaxID=467358 RepID=A0A9N9MIQ7_9CUCU|nr:unnamed protein product [Ceutorhynchus assimilis]